MGECVYECVGVCVCCKSGWLGVVGLSVAQLAVPHFCLPRHVETLQHAKVLMVRKERERKAVSVMNYVWRATLNSSPCQHIITPDCVIAGVTDTEKWHGS